MKPDDLHAPTFGEEQSADLRRQYARHAIRLILAFALLFAGVFYAFWWSGAALRFGAARVGGRGTPTWHVWGTVRNRATHEAIPWAVVEDDASGRPPFYRTDADQNGKFELVTLAEPHWIRVSAPGFRSARVSVGRAWFLWLPNGREQHEIRLSPD